MDLQIEASLALISGFRQQNSVGGGRNIGFANITTPEGTTTLFAVSGRVAYSNAITFPPDGEDWRPLFRTIPHPPGHDRDRDTEYKLLETIALTYRHYREIQVTLYLFTERPPCMSCEFVIQQFRDFFPRWELSIRHGE
ncbi:MAG: deaminase domain-containing protein [Leptolyngbyaceae bacterium]|nr:deaminase domain-containing protein [Leptolyngbyaceae bacterium]